ncbi:DUF397 domain-containing protein [Nocardia sp. NPDC059764]|uniref:DUF397 domain-containing protein n=1 Tax=Nocardia sp. NPDC059764 TaxID=3346939 RepID=UPI003655EA71
MTPDLSDVHWFKSSKSPSQDACVEIAWLEPTHVGVRDSKHPDGPALVFDGPQWDRFTDAVRAGTFDR